MGCGVGAGEIVEERRETSRNGSGGRSKLVDWCG